MTKCIFLKNYNESINDAETQLVLKCFFCLGGSVSKVKSIRVKVKLGMKKKYAFFGVFD